VGKKSSGILAARSATNARQVSNAQNRNQETPFSERFRARDPNGKPETAMTTPTDAAEVNPRPNQEDTSGGRCASACSPSYYTFHNRDGQTIQLRGDLTMEDLIRMGYTDIRLVQPEKPLAPHEWRADPISPENA